MRRHLRLDGIEESDELLMAMKLHIAADDGAVEDVVLIAGSTGSALRAVCPPNLHITPDVRRDLVYAASATGSL